jgi:hypothetical protein
MYEQFIEYRMLFIPMGILATILAGMLAILSAWFYKGGVYHL